MRAPKQNPRAEVGLGLDGRAGILPADRQPEKPTRSAPQHCAKEPAPMLELQGPGGHER
jgi:hypothetical protein